MDETRGTLFWNILKIIEKRKPKVVLLENVRNLAGRATSTSGRSSSRRCATRATGSPRRRRSSRRTCCRRSAAAGPRFASACSSPPRTTQPGIGDDLPVEPVALPSDRIDGCEPKQEWHLEDLLDDTHNIPGCDLTDSERLWIDAWDELVQTWYEAHRGSATCRASRSGRTRGPTSTRSSRLRRRARLPRPDGARPGLPQWKAGHLAKNYALYSQHREWIDRVGREVGRLHGQVPAVAAQAGVAGSGHASAVGHRDALSALRHPRQAPTYLPALVAITQTSIVGPRERRLSPRETARLQGLPDTFDFGDQRRAATYKQMGNGVNVGVVWHVLREHVRARRGRAQDERRWPKDPSGRAVSPRCRLTRS